MLATQEVIPTQPASMARVTRLRTVVRTETDRHRAIRPNTPARAPVTVWRRWRSRPSVGGERPRAEQPEAGQHRQRPGEEEGDHLSSQAATGAGDGPQHDDAEGHARG